MIVHIAFVKQCYAPKSNDDVTIEILAVFTGRLRHWELYITKNAKMKGRSFLWSPKSEQNSLLFVS
jgi:hypothetical protein